MTSLDKHKVTSIADYYADEGARERCHRVKAGDIYACEEIAKVIAEQLTHLKGFTLIPVPSRSGVATNNLTICLALAKFTGAHVLDCIKGSSRVSLYDLKKEGATISPELLSLYLTKESEHLTGPCYVFDAVVDTGTTMAACLSLLKEYDALPLTYAMTERTRYVNTPNSPSEPGLITPKAPSPETAHINHNNDITTPETRHFKHRR